MWQKPRGNQILYPQLKLPVTIPGFLLTASSRQRFILVQNKVSQV
jgi:hypothetical protein